jgi:uncharacterized membrane protein HdeD (DUF308 family)
MSYSVHLTIGVAALAVGGLYVSVGIRSVFFSRRHNPQGWRRLLLGILLIASGRYIFFQSVRITRDE